MTKKEFADDLLHNELKHVKQLLAKRDAEIQKITSGDFKFHQWLATQQEVDRRVKELEEMIKVL